MPLMYSSYLSCNVSLFLSAMINESIQFKNLGWKKLPSRIGSDIIFWARTSSLRSSIHYIAMPLAVLIRGNGRCQQNRVILQCPNDMFAEIGLNTLVWNTRYYYREGACFRMYDRSTWLREKSAQLPCGLFECYPKITEIIQISMALIILFPVENFYMLRLYHIQHPYRKRVDIPIRFVLL